MEGALEGNKYRSFMVGEGEKNTKWRYGGPPNYDAVDKLFEEGRTKVWPAGSLEEKVQHLVKTWEMEMFHKTSFDDMKSVDPTKYTFSLNGRKPITLEGKRKIGGGYNAFMQTSLPETLRGFNPAEETVDTAHIAFSTAFTRGFALEILQVYSGPPVIVYKFRHWGYMEGPFKGYAPTGELVEFFGMAIFEVDEHMKIVKVEFFLERGELLGGLMKGGSSGGLMRSFWLSFSKGNRIGIILYYPFRIMRRMHGSNPGGVTMPLIKIMMQIMHFSYYKLQSILTFTVQCISINKFANHCLENDQLLQLSYALTWERLKRRANV